MFCVCLHLACVIQGSRMDAKRRRFLQGMHNDKLESKSITIASPTAHFERDRMLYYKAIQETSIAPLNFMSTLRKHGPRPDDTCTRQQQLRKAKDCFSKSVSTTQVLLTLLSSRFSSTCTVSSSLVTHAINPPGDLSFAGFRHREP
jgi:hypothetical protein